jgi:DNA-binding phage protein
VRAPRLPIKEYEVILALTLNVGRFIATESTVNANVYVIIESCSTFGNASTPPDQEQEGSGKNTMPLTRDFRETIRERAQQEPRFRKALLREAIELMLSGDEKTGRAILRNYINATVGFRQLEEATSIPATSLMRMFGPNGNPSAKNLFGVLAHLQAQEGVNFEIRARRG